MSSSIYRIQKDVDHDAYGLISGISYSVWQGNDLIEEGLRANDPIIQQYRKIIRKNLAAIARENKQLSDSPVPEADPADLNDCLMAFNGGGRFR